MINLKNKKLTTLIVALSALVVFIALMVVATFYDLDISKKIADLESGYYSKNIFGRIFETIGEMPIYLLTAFGAVLIYQNFTRRKVNALSIIIRIGTLLISVVMLTYMFYKLFKYIAVFCDFSDALGDVLDYIGYFALAVIITFCLIWATRKVKAGFLNNMLIWSVIVICTAVMSQVLIQGIKYFAGRPRFRTMHTIGDYEIFKRWYQLSGHIKPGADMIAKGVASDAFKSFPSGHSGACAMLIVLTAIPYCFDKPNNVKYKVIFWLVAVISTLTVMFSRIVMGAHFLSDVLMGAFFTVISFYFCNFVVKFVFRKWIKLGDLNDNIGTSLVEESEISE